MPDGQSTIAAHAEVLRRDAQALTACTERLRAIEAALEAAGAAPPWLRAAVHAHCAACVTAAADLRTAVRHLLEYAEQAGR
ncbi:hypothetical protein B0I32_116127 [Nonomuraea fuscirosea]|uniref:Uncharacterized protein n=1 Tax=Nonomuraea fuscirosea TaxID=1291556 RepID=A0A2T0MR88_9ACTN|nr:hypothetical protein [Nonomuraea fuscirosea]PRX60736.1 hypothetical protein B0I32_116127 [Nonomuraea fuscirosea]